MMAYADFDYYTTQYFGKIINETDFPRLSLRASQYIDYITQGRAEKNCECRVQTAIKMCCCALAEQYQAVDLAKEVSAKSLSAGAGDGAEVQSETVGRWSRSYRSGGDSAQAASQAAANAQSTLYQIPQQYLGQTGLLYRGGRRCW